MWIMKRIKKICITLQGALIRKSLYISPTEKYMKRYVGYLRKRGMDIPQMPNYICNDVHFDGKDYSIIHLGKNSTVSTGVYFLTHDYSMHTVFAEGNSGMNIENPEFFKQWDKKDQLLILNGIHIGDNVFVGAKALLLPGTYIGDNSIVGAGAVVKGTYPAESIIVGNPAKVIGKTSEWLNKKAKKALEENENG